MKHNLKSLQLGGFAVSDLILATVPELEEPNWIKIPASSDTSYPQKSMDFPPVSSHWNFFPLNLVEVFFSPPKSCRIQKGRKLKGVKEIMC